MQLQTNKQTNIQNLFTLSQFAISRKATAEVATEIEPTRITDNALISCSFNVMNDRPVKEEFSVKEYRLWDHYGEAVFDRSYHSSMEKSPNHLIFLTGLVHCQKLLYLVLCKHFGFEYEPGQKEQLKIWPTSVQVEMPKMVRKDSDVIQKLRVTSIKKVSDTRFEVSLISDFEGIVKVQSKAAIFLL